MHKEPRMNTDEHGWVGGLLLSVFIRVHPWLFPFPCRSVIVLVFAVSFADAGEPSRYFRVEVVDAATGRGVPMVELSTTGHAAFVTDSRGLVAFDEPGLMGHEVWL